MAAPPEPPGERLEQRLAKARSTRRDRDLQRRRRALEPLPGLRLRDGERVLHDFSSNDYLGLASRAASGRSGAGASALVTGYGPEQRQLEAELASFLGREAALVCSSGYLANLAVVTSLAGRGDSLAMDRLCHASLIDGARLSGAHVRRYAHADPAAAAARLAGTSGHRLLVTDGVFSMDGDRAPLAALKDVARAADATLVVDDAHGIGVLGEGGGGLCETLGLDPRDVPVLIGTLGKAFGAAGAFVAGDRDLVEHLENHGRSVIYSTALPPAVAKAALDALPVIRDARGPRCSLRERVEGFRAGAAERGLPFLPSDTPIQPLVLGAPGKALALQAFLESRGFLVAAIRPPTVPEGTSRLRITLSAAHREDTVTALLDAIAEGLALPETGAGRP